MFLQKEILDKIKDNSNILYLISLKFFNFTINLSTTENDVVYDNNNYLGGYVFKKIDFNTSLENSYEDIIIQISSEIENININQYLLSNSNVEIKLACYTDDDLKKEVVANTIFKGYVKTSEINANFIVLSISPNISKLNKNINDMFSPICRHCLGGEKCMINFENYKASGVIIEILSNDSFLGNHRENKQVSIGYYKYGMVKFLSGKLCGFSFQIKDELDNKVFLLKTTNLISIGDKYEIYAGCDKTINTCKEKFNNVINFGGEPYINNN